MTYRGFGYAVDSCPLNETEFFKGSTRLNCSVDKYGHSQYTCVPNEDKTTLVEFCYRAIVGFYQRGHCLVTIDDGYLDQINCRQFKDGCPQENFRGTDLYKFPACQNINTEQQCFYADPSCPNRTAIDVIDSSLTNATVNSTWYISTTETILSETESTDIGLILGSIFSALIITFIILALIIWKRRRLRNIYQGVRVIIGRDEEDEYNFEAGEYSEWKTSISDLTNEEVSLLFCFLCADSGTPDFYAREWLDILNEIREKVYKANDPATSAEAQYTRQQLIARNLIILEDEDRGRITDDAANETIYRISSCIPVLFYLSSYATASRYLRTQKYQKKPGEICVISNDSDCDSLLIKRLQMDILTHDTLEDTDILKEVANTLKIPYSIVEAKKDERVQFVQDLKQNGEPVHYRGQSQDRAHQVKWRWRDRKFVSPNIVRSSIGAYGHCDVYITGNIAYIKRSKYHSFSPGIKSLIYSMLFVDSFSLDINKKAHKSLLKKIREEYFKELVENSEDVKLNNLPNDIQTQGSILTFATDKIRHDVMYAFITEYCVEYSDLEFFLNTVTPQVIAEYCRSYWFKTNEKERFLFLQRENYNSLIDRLQLDILKYFSEYDEDVYAWISTRLKVPIEILMWDLEARERYVEYANKGTETVHHARGMIVGCAGAGKTTLLKRLLRFKEDEILNVKSTVGLEVHEEVFEICNGELKVRNKHDNADATTAHGGGTNDYPRILSFFDFGGQCAYYACHQIYLTRRAFYVLVIDASKPLDRTVDREVCDQDNTLFSSWTYADYFAFWIKSILTFCFMDVERKPDILLVATHWEQSGYKNEIYSFMQKVGKNLPNMMALQHYIPRDNCFFTQFPLSPLTDLEKHIVSCASDSRWSENVPKEWLCLDVEIHNVRHLKRIVEFQYILSKMPGNVKQSAKDMLRFYHDAGKVLYFNEPGLDGIVIIDVQWFVDAFKNIITDSLHTCGISTTNTDWILYYETGHLKDTLLSEIWRLKDDELLLSLENTQKRVADFEKDPRCIMFHKEKVLSVMQRLGLMALGDESHYVPCMNREALSVKIKDRVSNAKSKAPVLVFLFDFLPYFLYFRLIVGCIQNKNWMVLEDGKALYRNASFFNFSEHFIVVSVTGTSIMVHVYHPLEELNPSKTLEIKRDIRNTLLRIIESFHKKVSFQTGFICRKYKEIGEEIKRDFIEESYFINRSGRRAVCPRHQVKEYHELEPEEYNKYWRE